MKRIITCSDGTWNKPGEEDNGQMTQTNVQKIFELIHKTDVTNNIIQIKFYDEGVGSEGNSIQKIMGGATGAGLDEKILDAYKFIVWNFEEGDELYLFGFSRGAYTARSLAGLIRTCGIVKDYNLLLINEAYAIYRNRDHKTADHKDALDFKAKNSHDPHIKFVGVWDTVGALGIPLESFRLINKKKYSFHDVQLSSTIDNAFQALAIDEHREQFEPSIWLQSPKIKEHNPNQKLEQVWFAGAHSDVGGGYSQTGLSDITLLWMIEKAISTGLSIKQPTNLSPNYCGTLHNSRTGFYKLTPPYYRPIDLANPISNEALSPSATERMNDKNCDYKPENKITALK
jgi:uncharacterized protein (DUF2235 family)